MTERPLAGRRILVTRAAHQAGKLSDALRRLGAEPIEVPVLEIRPPQSSDPLDRALRQLESYDWLVFTSANAVRALVERIAALGIALQPSRSMKVAAVGAATAKAAGDAGFPVTFVPESYVAESLVDGLLKGDRNEPGRDIRPGQRNESGHDLSPTKTSVQEGGDLALGSWTGFVTGHDFSRAETAKQNESGHDFSRAKEFEAEDRALAPEENFARKRILLARAAVARDIIPEALRTAGAQVDVVDAYQNLVPESAPELLRQALEKGIDAATFTSSSSVGHLAEAAQKAGIDFPFAGVPSISIGPITSQTLREEGWPPAAEAKTSDIPGLVEAVRSFFSH